MNKILKNKIYEYFQNKKLKCIDCESENIVCLKILMEDGSKKYRCENCYKIFSDKTNCKEKNLIVYK